jgi:ABC-type cobalamin/Fe3+-siderophores transport system ATPase subunit
MTIVDIRNLDFAYGREAVLEDVNLTVRQKDFMAIIGPNGGGKTTLLKLVLGLLKPVRGTIHVDGNFPKRLLRASATCRRMFTQTAAFRLRRLTWCSWENSIPNSACPGDLQPIAVMPGSP